MSSIRINGKPEKLGPVSSSSEFIDWEVPDQDSESRMRRIMSGMGRSSVILDSMKYGGLQFGDSAHASFVENDEFLGGRDDSKHQVRFGQLILNGRDFREQPEFVALKPYDDRRDLYREWAAHEYLNSLFDRQVGYINLGVVNSAQNTRAIISQYDHDVISFDSSFWAGDDMPAAALRPEVLRRHASLAMESLGMFHGVRMTHGDAQAKNLAADRYGPRAIDLETAQILDEETIDDPSTYDQTRKDISSFIYSVGQVEENREAVIRALSPDTVAAKLVRSYQGGVRKGRAALDGAYVPDFGRYNEDFIRSELDKVI